MHTKSKQANDIILKENDRTISDKKEIANLLNDYFVHIADSMPEIRVEDYGEDYAIIPASKQSMNTGTLVLQLASVFIAQVKPRLSYY